MLNHDAVMGSGFLLFGRIPMIGLPLRSRTHFALLVISVIAQTPPNAQAEEDDTARITFKQARERESAVKRLKIEWEEDCFEAKGARFNPEFSNSRFTKSPLPPTDSEFQQFHTLAIDGHRTSHFGAIRMYGKEGELVYDQTRVTFNSEECLSLSLPNQSRHYPYGRIYPENHPNNELSLLAIEPILHCFRLLDPDWKVVRHDNYSFSTEPLNEYVVYSEQGASRPLKHVFWLDPKRNFLVVRFELHDQRRTGLLRQTDFEYQEDPDHKWQLSGWKFQSFSLNGTLDKTISAKVTKLEINPDLPDSEFTISFPEGTYVDNLREGRNYVIKQGYVKRFVSDVEGHLGYDALMRTSTPPVPANWLLIGNVFVLCAIGCAYALRRNRKLFGHFSFKHGER